MKLFLKRLWCTLSGHSIPNLDGKCQECGKVIASPLPPAHSRYHTQWPAELNPFDYQVEDDDYDSRN